MLQCVAVCCSVLQCVAVCCNVLQCVQCVAVHNRTSLQQVFVVALQQVRERMESVAVVSACCSMCSVAVVVAVCRSTQPHKFGARVSGGHAAGERASALLQFVAVCCSVVHCFVGWCIVLQCVAVCCSVLQWAAVGCSVF